MTERLRLIVRMGRCTHPLLATWGTTLCALVILPLLDSYFYVSFGQHIYLGEFTEAVLAAGMTAALISALNGSAQSVVRDVNLGIFLPIMAANPVSISYWSMIILVPAVLACIPQALCLALGCVGVYLAGWSISVVSVVTLLGLLGVVACVGATLGALIAAASVSWKNPYLISNILVACIPLLVGTIVPLSSYPSALQYLALLVPGSMVIEAGRTLIYSSCDLSLALVQTGVSCAVWMGVLIAAITLSLRRLKNGAQRGVL